ncbi:MAG: hypothetical protein WCA29_14815 [Jiangellales bacterium]
MAEPVSLTLERRGPGQARCPRHLHQLLRTIALRTNAAYLRRAHPEVTEIVHAADDFDHAAAAYEATHAILSAEPNPSGARHGVAQHLREAATAERRAGQRFLHHASRPTPVTTLPAKPA